MSGNKEFTLGKSSEISTYLLIQEAKNFKEDNISLLKEFYKDIVVSIISAFISAVITFIVENPASVLKTENTAQTNTGNFDMFFKLIDKILHGLLLFIICFLVLMIIYWGIKKVIKAFSYKKSTKEGRERLVQLFHLKVFNQIMLGISFYNKFKSLKEDGLFKIYLWEAVHYFDVSREDIDSENIIEDYNENNKKNREYKELMKDLNPYLLYETFDATCSILLEIKNEIGQIPEYESNDELVDKINSLHDEYNSWLNNISHFIQQNPKL